MIKNLKSIFAKNVQFVIILLLAFSTFAPLARPQVAHATSDTIYNDATVVNLTGDDNNSEELDFPFAVNYYNQTFNHFAVSTNGYVSFINDAHEFTSFRLNVFNQDLVSWDAKNIYIKTIGSSPNRKFMIQWTNSGICCSSSVPLMTFSVIISETSNTIQYQYLYNQGGVESDGTYAGIGLATSHGNEVTLDNGDPIVSPRFAVLFTPTDTENYTTDDSATYYPALLKVPDQPASPTIIYPANDTANVSSLSWNESANATVYKVYMSHTPEFTTDSTIASAETTETHISLNDFVSESDFNIVPHTFYYWFVQAINEDGTASSETRTFVSVAAAGHNISNCDQLQAISETGTRYDTFNLTQDIDCTGVDFVPLYFDSELPYRGTFNGHGFAINNLNIDTDDSFVGLFSETDVGAVLENLYINGEVSGDENVGGLAGFTRGTTISNVHSNVVVNGTDNYVGGLVGQSYASLNETMTISDSSSSSFVTGNSFVGGLVGYAQSFEGSTLIQRSFSVGTVDQLDPDQVNYGGLVGLLAAYTEDDHANSTTIVQDSFSRSDVDASANAGGFIGRVEVSNGDQDSTATVAVQRSYSSGTVTASNFSGGFIGDDETQNSEGNALNLSDNFSASEVDITGDEVFNAGFIGTSGGADPVLSSNYYASDLTEDNANCSTIGIPSGCTGVEDINNFKGNSTNPPFKFEGDQVWNFADTWQTEESEYPDLRGFSITDSLTINSAETDAQIVINQSGCNEVSDGTSSKESGLALQDSAFSYPVGFVGFLITGCPSGGTATLTALFVGSFDPDLVVVRKFNANTNQFSTISGATKTMTTLDGHPALRVTYSITDGGALDQDGVANGTIVDPVGPALNDATAPNTGFGGATI